eukprot:TRINITY_DN30774_c0_g1_i1.p1 TRINITY_DN30774_c0_g1~~TRINITY_DN30774_c0_g1_i1.p1  ORF type:complete len:383 (+),score=82.04 TRINITY_DN30774_c0_g1_i1:42-1190(+)
MASPLVLALPGSAVYKELVLGDALDPSTWAATEGGCAATAPSRSLAQPTELERFLQDTSRSLGATPENIYLSVAQDDDGRHRFVRLGDLRRPLNGEHRGSSLSRRLVALPEGEVKAAQAAAQPGAVALLYARPRVAAESAGGSGGAAASRASVAASSGDVAALERAVNAAKAQHRTSLPARFGPAHPLAGDADSGKDDLCPKSSIWASNYTVIPDLSVGRTQRLILCDEATLTRSLPEERIFEHLMLIVNCHESSVPGGKYKVGACGTGPMPDVICQAVHQWHSLGAAYQNEVNDSIQAAIWENLQKGTVAVHCLAGIHRAACIVACQFLWRHYALGQHAVPADAQEIYRRLKAVRPHVSPAYTHVLRNYEQYLRAKFPASG